jgi:hypothetical protein
VRARPRRGSAEEDLRELPNLAAALDADVSNLQQVQSAFAEAFA